MAIQPLADPIKVWSTTATNADLQRHEPHQPFQAQFSAGEMVRGPSCPTDRTAVENHSVLSYDLN